MLRVLAKIAGIIVIILTAAYGWLWLSAQRTIPLSVSPSDRAFAVANADRIADLGPEPDKWPVRLFIPGGALQDIAGTVIGTTYRMPFGSIGPNGPEGYLVATVRQLDFIPTDFLLRAQVEMDVTYSPVVNSPWWSDATIRFMAKADMLPVPVATDGAQTLGFRLVPTGFSPAIRWGPLNVAATELLSHVVASHLLERMGRDLIIPIPAHSVPIDIRSGMVATHQGAFPAGGRYRLTAQLDGGALRGEISTDRLLVVSSGVWLLGGLPDTAPMPLRPMHEEGAIEPDQKALAIKARLEPFERTSGNAEAHIPIEPILSMFRPGAASAASGTAANLGYVARAAMTEASGPLFKKSLVNNRVVGDVYLALSPASPDFASGTLALTPLGVQWQKGLGLSGELDATVHAQAQFRAYLSGTRLSQAMGATMGVKGVTKTTIPFTLGLQLIREGTGSAVMLVPEVRCTRVTVDLHQDKGAAPLFSTPRYSLQSAGVRVERNIGGGAVASFALIDSKPRYVPFPQGAALAQGITWPSDGIAVTTAPKTVVAGEDGIDVTLSLHARSAAKREASGFAAQRAELHAALRHALPVKACPADQQFRLLL